MASLHKAVFINNKTCGIAAGLVSCTLSGSQNNRSDQGFAGVSDDLDQPDDIIIFGNVCFFHKDTGIVIRDLPDGIRSRDNRGGQIENKAVALTLAQLFDGTCCPFVLQRADEQDSAVSFGIPVL